MSTSIYTDGEYLEKNPTWHAEDSAWKSKQVSRILGSNAIECTSVCEIGCGAGEILVQLRSQLPETVSFAGYEISPQAYELASTKSTEGLTFHLGDVSSIENGAYDVLLLIDVLEHVPDYMGLLRECSTKAKYKVYHIPLDIHISSIIRKQMIHARHAVGHLHYFTAETALATLEDTGHRILDFRYTNGAIELAGRHASAKRKLANLARQASAAISVPLSARLLGGYSLLVLAE